MTEDVVLVLRNSLMLDALDGKVFCGSFHNIQAN